MSLLNSFFNNTLLSNLIKIRWIAIIKWEHIQRVFIKFERNESETARRLRMHRKTFQKIFNKRATR